MNGVYAFPVDNSTGLNLNQWSTVKVSQTFTQEKNYLFSIEIDNVKIFAVQNERAQPFYGVTEFWSDPWTASARAKVRKIFVRSERGLCKSSN